MAVYSQNGYTANDRSVIMRYTVSDSGRVMSLRIGSPGELLAHFIRWFDKNIRDIDPGIMDDWSYAERPIRGQDDELSNHASGTAADVDATKWPLGVTPEAYLSGPEIAKVREQLKLYEDCIRWGGDYTGRKDPMHFEINRNLATCERVWAKIRAMEAVASETQSNKEDVDMILIRNSKGTVALLASDFAEWVPTVADHVALQKAMPQVQLTDDFFNRVVKAAQAGTASTVAIARDLADEEPPK